MSCHGCASKFGFLSKEKGCPACGFSYCNSCLKAKCPVPKLDNKVCKVCTKCFNSLAKEGNSQETMPHSGESKFSAPDSFLKRLESLDSPAKPPVTVYRAEPRLQMLMRGLNSTDLEIVTRLEKLREGRDAVNVPSDDEIASRLSALRGEDVSKFPSKSNYSHLVPDNRSGEQQTQDLLKQFQSEVELNSKMQTPEDEIAERLNRLRSGYELPQQPPAEGDTAQKSASSITLDEIAQMLAHCELEAGKIGKHTDLATIASLEKIRTRLMQQNEKMDEGISSDEDEAKAATKIISKVQAEVDLEKSLGIAGNADEEEDAAMDADTSDKEELPWCIICNEDAKVRCLGCDGDLFCKSCFQEGHIDEDTKAHAFQPYKKK